jgi:hypothetical protein
MDSSHRRTRVTIALIAALVLVATLAAACSAQATGGSAGSLAPSSSSAQGGASSEADAASSAATGAKGADAADWTRVLDALASMQATTPTKPIVVLLGGSAARESTIDDASWRAQIVKNGGPATLAWNMGSRNRTVAQNVAIVKNLPQGAHALVLIGINLGAFTSAQKTASVALPSSPPTESISLQQPHQYGTKKTGILSAAKKKALVQAWLADRYPVFRRNFGTSADVLETLIKECKERGYKPVLFELPRNTQIIGSSLDAPTAKYRARCLALHKKYDVPWVSLISAARLPNSSFYDLWHLVEPGRNVWQSLLSAKTAALLKQYGYDGGGS